jgi:hypothetical protein
MRKRCELKVRSVVIDWMDKVLEITDTAGSKHIVPLNKKIHVVLGYAPDSEEKTMLARDLGKYMSQGYVIDQIDL